jgi:hypothetical protein
VVSTAADFSFLADSARRFVAILSSRPAFEGRRGERGSALIGHVDFTTKGLKSRIDELDRDFQTAGTDLEREVAFKNLRLVSGYAHFMRKALPWVEDAKDPPLELGSLYFIDELSELMLGEVADVVPTRSSEYSTEQQPFKQLFPNLKITPDPEARRSIILNFPALEARSFPLLPLFAHEIGHTVVTKYGLVDKVLSKSRADSDFAKALKESKTALMEHQKINLFRANLIIEERLELWTTELLCDQLAMQHLGPSYLLAFSAYVLPLSWDAPGPRHPPTTFRIARLLNWVAKTPWEDMLRTRLPVSLAWLEKASSSPHGLGPALSLLLDALDQAQAHLSSVVSETLDHNVYAAGSYLELSGYLDEQLQHEILPVQHPVTRKPFDPRAILIAGWLSLHEEAAEAAADGETPATLCEALSNWNSNAFFTKALELSRVLNIWEQTK